MGMVVAFNLLMIGLGAMAEGAIDAPFVVAWIVGTSPYASWRSS